MPDRKRPSSADPQVLALFQEEMARAAAMSCLAPPGPSLWPRFAEYYQGLARLPRKARRALQRQWRCSLGGLALLCTLGQAPALAATINVGGGCTLLDAVAAANANAARGGCTAGSGADTITLPAGSTQVLTSIDNTTRGPTGLPVITSGITIQGNGSTIRRDPSAPAFRILVIGTGGDLMVRDARLSGGAATGSEGFGPRGGGMFNSRDGTLALTNSTVSGNFAVESGGGVYNYGTLTLTNSTVEGNSAGSNGGGVHNDNGGTLTLTHSTVSGNSAGSNGGGVFNALRAVTLTNSTVSGNSAGSNGGGLSNYSGPVTLINSTVSGNSAGGVGGGVFNRGAVPYRGTLTLVQTLVSGNSASSDLPEVYNLRIPEYAGNGTVYANAFNLFGHDGSAGVVNFTPGATDLVPGAALTAILSPALADNGGPTMTHSLVAGSPAADRIPAASCATTTDQRGLPRPQDGDGNTIADCDIGAFELEAAPPQPPLPQPQPPLPPPPEPSPPTPPPAPNADTAPLGLSNPQPFGCELVGDEIVCAETGATLPFIRFDVDISENAGFLQFDYTFTGADRAVSGADRLDIVGRSDGEGRQRASIGDLGAVFVVNVPIAALPASGVLQEGMFQSSGQSGLPRSGRGTLIVTNFPSGAPGSVFRVRNLRVDRCAQKCFGKRATLCGTDGRDKLTGTRRRDVIVGRDGNDTIKGLGGNDLICGGEGKDKILGGPGSDRLDGGLGRDTCDGGPGTDSARRCDRKRAIP